MDWVPAIGLRLGFLLDRLSLFFGLVVTGVGVLVSTYASSYLAHRQEDLSRFFAYLLFFMGCMLGVVFSSNLLSLFLFWELTGLASFLLIGFETASSAAQRGARMAFLTTAATGLLLMVGVILVGSAFGSLDFSVLLNPESTLQDPRKLAWAIPFLLAGAFGKSAQFPLHFWLPQAMSAPTPVSAYLHSATMVKLGVFLVARLSPVFADAPAWTETLLAVCFFTSAFAAVLSFLSHDLKSILAYSTVSQLGVLMGFYGLGKSAFLSADLLHILAHVLYKGGLFMVAGMVDHAMGTRDIRLLGGLGRKMPGLAIVSFLLCASLASFPGTLAFVSKELILADFLAQPPDAFSLMAFFFFLFAAALKVAIALRLFSHLFLRKAPVSPSATEHAHEFHAPSLALLGPAALLAAASLALGLFPGLLESLLRWPEAGGGSALPQPELHAWHGLSQPFLYSAGAVGVGTLVFGLASAWGWEKCRVPRALEFDRFFDMLFAGTLKLASLSVRVLRADSSRDVLGIVLAFIALCALVVLGRHAPELFAATSWRDVMGLSAQGNGLELTRVTTCVVMVVSGIVVLFSRQVLTRLVATSLIGLLVTVLYVLFRAPDLALTQILVETLVLIATVMLLVRLRAVEFLPSNQVGGLRRLVHIGIALAFGALMTGLVLVVQSRGLLPAERLGSVALEKSFLEAAGTNAVNTILVDFRGTDTLFEITVLVIAALGCVGAMTSLTHKQRSSEQMSSDDSQREVF
jgi:NADH:ubiquinone oxidoreductase subunit 5 (subunit L)/multisubunit Na+/H+ antiporter MnhA subunit/multisubunit Na+/H+ antiporter MnhB subunit